MRADSNNLISIYLKLRNQKLTERLNIFKNFMAEQTLTFKRTVLSAADREVIVRDPFSGIERNMLMFASNNYLGLANHHYV